MTATYTKERELPAARSALEPVNVQVLLHHRDGVESGRHGKGDDFTMETFIMFAS